MNVIDESSNWAGPDDARGGVAHSTVATGDSETSTPQYQISGKDVPENVLYNPNDLLAGLTQKPRKISCVYYYDDRGSQLFERLCAEPSYYLTRTEQRIMDVVAPQLPEILGPVSIVELGCGNGDKACQLLAPFVDRFGTAFYLPIDINRSILIKNARAVRQMSSHVNIQGHAGTFGTGLRYAGQRSEPKCIVFLGSTIGNMEDAEIRCLMQEMRAVLRQKDYLIIGLDLDKDSETLEAAYNNQTAVLTNLCVLAHVNWRFGGNFDMFGFRHVSFHNREKMRIESHLEATERHRVRLTRLGVSFEIEEGERILTEISRKFAIGEFVSTVAEQGFHHVQTWFGDNKSYAVCLFCAGRT